MKCPNCGANMKIRLASRGRAKGRYFWGCSTYPQCKETVAARLEDLPQRELGVAGYVTCPQCAGSGTDMRTPLLKWLFGGTTGLETILGQSRFTVGQRNDDNLSSNIERLSLHKSCELCLGTGLRLLPSVEAARRGLAMEAKVFEAAREDLRKNAEDSKSNDDEIARSQEARERWRSSSSDEEDYSLLVDEKRRIRHLDQLRRSFDDLAEGEAAFDAEEHRLNALDSEEHRKRLKGIVEKRKIDLAIANRGYELAQAKERLDSARPGILAALVESAHRAGSIRILLGIALKIAADNAKREHARTRPQVAAETADLVEDEPNELASEEDLALDEDYPLDDWALSPSLELLAPEDLDSEEWVEVIFSHPSDHPNFGEQDDSPGDDDEA